MSERVVDNPANHGWVDAGGGKWKWSGTGTSYDDTEIRGLISDNATAISDNATAISDNATAISVLGGDIAVIDGRITALEDNTGGSFWVEESPGVIKYTGTAKATDVVATG